MAPCSVGEGRTAILPGCWAANSDVFEEGTLIADRKHRGIDCDSLYFAPRLEEFIRIGPELLIRHKRSNAHASEFSDESGPRPEVHSAEAQASSELGGTNPSLTAFRFK
jgi:hypothetical protein